MADIQTPNVENNPTPPVKPSDSKIQITKTFPKVTEEILTLPKFIPAGTGKSLVDQWVIQTPTRELWLKSPMPEGAETVTYTPVNLENKGDVIYPNNIAFGRHSRLALQAAGIAKASELGMMNTLHF